MICYLHIFCSSYEKFAQLIEQDVGKRLWKLFPISRGPKISNLMFIDDVILFVGVNVEQARLISDCLTKFYVVSR